MSAYFVSIAGRAAFYCEGCNAFHQIPMGYEIRGEDAHASVVRKTQLSIEPASMLCYRAGCVARISDGIIEYDRYCDHIFHGQQRPLKRAPSLAFMDRKYRAATA